jgi:hypothetical protein
LSEPILPGTSWWRPVVVAPRSGVDEGLGMGRLVGRLIRRRMDGRLSRAPWVATQPGRASKLGCAVAPERVCGIANVAVTVRG